MAWLTILFAFLIAFAAAFGASFLSLAWKRRRKSSVGEQRIEFLLPGHDCGLCGYGTCRDYAEAIDRLGADPALCSPGGAELENSLRSLLSEREGDGRAAKLRAIVRCGASKGAAGLAFDYDNREDCATAAILYGGPKICKDGCLGFGSCAKACPLGAIRVRDGPRRHRRGALHRLRLLPRFLPEGAHRPRAGRGKLVRGLLREDGQGTSKSRLRSGLRRLRRVRQALDHGRVLDKRRHRAGHSGRRGDRRRHSSALPDGRYPADRAEKTRRNSFRKPGRWAIIGASAGRDIARCRKAIL